MEVLFCCCCSGNVMCPAVFFFYLRFTVWPLGGDLRHVNGVSINKKVYDCISLWLSWFLRYCMYRCFFVFFLPSIQLQPHRTVNSPNASRTSSLLLCISIAYPNTCVCPFYQNIGISYMVITTTVFVVKIMEKICYQFTPLYPSLHHTRTHDVRKQEMFSLWGTPVLNVMVRWP